MTLISGSLIPGLFFGGTMLVSGLAMLLLVNLVTLLRFREDKRRAVAGAWRVPESTLLGLAAQLELSN